MSDTRYSFLVEWLDPQAAMLRQYMLFYYEDGSIEMDDLRNRRKFLRRGKYDALEVGQLHIGATVTVYSRQLTIKEYADAFTKNKFSSTAQKTLAMIKPDAVQQGAVPDILDAIYSSGFRVARLKMLQMSPGQAQMFYEEHQGKPFYNNLTGFMSSGPIVALELVHAGAIQKWRDLIGPTNTQTAQQEAPRSIRARFGTDGTCNAVHGSDSDMSAEREISFFFGGRKMFSPTVQFRDSALLMIKPSTLRRGDGGKILGELRHHGFEITALEQFTLNRANAEEFLEVYAGVVPGYQKMVDEVVSGPCLVAALCRLDGGPCVQDLRALCGPHDPEMGRLLRPDTLRAKFGGKDSVDNGVHCTDLEEDGQLEVEYFFKILQ